MTKNKRFTKKINRQFLYCLFIAVLMTLNACATRFIPIQEPGLIVSEDLAVYKTNELVLTVSEQMWVKDPQYLSDHYTTFWVKIQNNSNETIKILPKDFALLDEFRNQQDVQDYEQVLELMMQDETLYVDRFLMSVQTQQEIMQRRSQIQRNIIMDSFAFGEILPRASKQGIIYFPKVKANTNRMVFVFNKKEITFQRMK
jgi:hypothetical protein